MRSSFAKKVYVLTRRIPRGRVATYGAISRALCGSLRASRAVGQALHRNPSPFFGKSSPSRDRVPCHRVVRSDGGLGGYAGGFRKKRELLREEGVRIVSDRVDLREFYFSF